MALAALVTLVAGAAAFVWVGNRQPLDAKALVSYLPANTATTLYVDVAVLRQTGYLEKIAGPQVTGDADYAEFTKQTGFDYRKDLDQAVIGFRGDQRFMAVQGRLDWDKLSAYAKSQGGHCEKQRCEVKQADSGRYFAFQLVRRGVLLGAFDKSSQVLNDLQFAEHAGREIPAGPVWIETSGKEATGSRLWPFALGGVVADSMSKADRLNIAIAPSATGLALKMEADFPNVPASDQARIVLATLIDLLKKDASVKKDGSLMSALRQGQLEQRETKLRIVWPFPTDLFAGS